MKMEILDKIAQAIFVFKGYPDKHEVASVASALVLKYPCLTEPGAGTGWDGWKISIKYKVANYRSKLREAGCNEVNVNRKRGQDGDEGRFTLKKPKRGEVNHVPDYPDGQDADTLEEQRLALVDEMKKKRRDAGLIRQKMQLTFSLRRKEIIEVQPMVSEVQARWPVLFSEDEICEEFYRVTNKDLLGTFRASLDEHTPQLLKLYRARRGAIGKKMEDLLDKLDDQTSDILVHRKTTALEGLPLFVREENAKLLKTCLETDAEERQTRGFKVGILTVVEDDVATTFSLPKVNSIDVVLEEAVVLRNLLDLPTAFAYLFGLLYALDIAFPKELKYTFEVIQKVLMELGTDCSQRVRSLKTKLLL